MYSVFFIEWEGKGEKVVESIPRFLMWEGKALPRRKTRNSSLAVLTLRVCGISQWRWITSEKLRSSRLDVQIGKSSAIWLGKTTVEEKIVKNAQRTFSSLNQTLPSLYLRWSLPSHNFLQAFMSVHLFDPCHRPPSSIMDFFSPQVMRAPWLCEARCSVGQH